MNNNNNNISDSSNTSWMVVIDQKNDDINTFTNENQNKELFTTIIPKVNPIVVFNKAQIRHSYKELTLLYRNKPLSSIRGMITLQNGFTAAEFSWSQIQKVLKYSSSGKYREPKQQQQQQEQHYEYQKKEQKKQENHYHCSLSRVCLDELIPELKSQVSTGAIRVRKYRAKKREQEKSKQQNTSILPDFTLYQIRQLLNLIKTTKNIQLSTILPNGIVLGDFITQYICATHFNSLQLDEKRRNKKKSLLNKE